MSEQASKQAQDKLSPIYVFESQISHLAKIYATDVMETGWVGLGKQTEMFEREFAGYIGAKYAVGMNSATAALHIALLCAGVKRNLDAFVLTTPMTFISTNAAILYCGAEPVFLDINPMTLSNDIDAIIKEINVKGTSFYSAIILVHYGGNPILKSEIQRLEKVSGDIPIIHDVSHCTGAEYEDGTVVGSYGHFNVFSFHAVKNLATPDGGMFVTDILEVAERAKRLRWMGINKDTFTRTKGVDDPGYQWFYDVDEVGYKYHMNDISAAIGRAHLLQLKEQNDHRREIRRYYINEIKKAEFIIGYPDTLSSGHMATAVVITPKARNRVISELKQKYNIHPGVHYTPNNRFKPFCYFSYPTPHADDVYEHIMTLPCHLKMTDEDVERVINAMNEILEK